MKHILNIKSAADRSGKTYKEIGKSMGMGSNALSAAIKRDRERKEWIRLHHNDNKGEKEISGGFRMEFLEKLAAAIGCDLFDLWETRDEDGNKVELYPNAENKTEKSDSPKNSSIIEDITANELTFDDAINTPRNVEMKDGIVTCPHCGQKVRPFQFFK